MSTGVRPQVRKHGAVGKERREEASRGHIQAQGKQARDGGQAPPRPQCEIQGRQLGERRQKCGCLKDLPAQRASDAAAAKLVAKQQVERLI